MHTTLNEKYSFIHRAIILLVATALLTPALALAETHPPAMRRSLLRHCRTRALKRGDGQSHLIDQGFNDDGHHSGNLHVEHVGSTR